MVYYPRKYFRVDVGEILKKKTGGRFKFLNLTDNLPDGVFFFYFLLYYYYSLIRSSVFPKPIVFPLFRYDIIII